MNGQEILTQGQTRRYAEVIAQRDGIPAHLSLYVLDMAALKGEMVCQGHADVCKILGHGKNVRDGVEQGWCPRCGSKNGKVQS